MHHTMLISAGRPGAGPLSSRPAIPFGPFGDRPTSQSDAGLS